MSQRERDVLKVMSLVLSGKRTQAEAGRLPGRSERQVRRLESAGNAGVIHKLRGRASNRQSDPSLRRAALGLCRTKYAGFGPTLAAEKLSEDDQIEVSVGFTLRSRDGHQRRTRLGHGWSERNRHRQRDLHAPLA